MDASKSNIVNVHDAKTNFSRLLDRAHAGEEIVIAKAGTPFARLVPLERPKFANAIGIWKGKFTYPEDFNDPDPEIERLFGLRD